MDMVQTLGAFVDFLKAHPELPQDFCSVDISVWSADRSVSAHLRTVDDEEKEASLLAWAVALGCNLEYGEPSRILTLGWTRKVSAIGTVNGVSVHVYALVGCEVTVKTGAFAA